MLSILVVSTKGGCGKTTVATNLAAAFSAAGWETSLADMDPQASSLDWGEMRPEDANPVELIDWSRTFERVPRSTERLVIDAPAAIPRKRVEELLKRADVVIVPVLPSRFDENATRRFLGDLERMKLVRRGRRDVAIVANRVRAGQRTSQGLEDFLDDVGHPVVTRLADSQRYPQYAAHGLGLADFGNARVRKLLEDWEPLYEFLDEVAEDPASASGISLGKLAGVLLDLGTGAAEKRAR